MTGKFALILSLAAPAAAAELQCPFPSVATARECLSAVVAPAACCMWSVPENLVGSPGLSDLALALGSTEQQANLAGLITCNTIVTSIDMCAKKVEDHVTLGPIFAQSADAAALASKTYVAMLCAAACKDDVPSQNIMNPMCGALPAVPTLEDPSSVYTCPPTTTDDGASGTDEGETTASSAAETTAATTTPKAQPGSTTAELDTNGACSRLALATPAGLAMAWMAVAL